MFTFCSSRWTPPRPPCTAWAFHVPLKPVRRATGTTFVKKPELLPTKELLILISLLVILAATAQPGEIAERLAQPPSFVLESAKSPDRLELCVADVISNNFTAAAFHDGPDRTVVVGSLNIQFHNGVPIAVELLRMPIGTKVIARLQGKGNARIQTGIQACL